MVDRDSEEGSPLILWNNMGSKYGPMTIIASTTALVVVVTTVWILLSYYMSSLSLKRKLKGRHPVPPGSLGLPLIGETPQFIIHYNGNKMVSFCESREAKYGQTFKTSFLGSPTVVMEPPAGNKFLFANEGKLVENSWPKSMYALLGLDSLTFKKGEAYKIGRRQFAAFFSPEAVARYLPQIERNTLDHLAEFWQPPASAAGGRSEEFELSAFSNTQKFTFKLIADLCLGPQPGPEMEKLEEVFRVWAGAMMQVPINLPGFAFHRGLKARAIILEVLEEHIATRRLELEEGRATPTQDVLSCLLTQPDETGRMASDAAIKDNILLILFAGHDTSSSVLSMVIMCIAMYPQVRLRLKEEHDAVAAQKGEGKALTLEDTRGMKYTWRVVQETMRLLPPVTGTFREAIVDFEYNGYTIPKGWKLHWINQRSHENSKFFNDPKKFDPSRFEGSGPAPYTYIPFGGGPRMCPGNEFAKLEMLVFLHYLVINYTWALVDPDEPIIRRPMPRSAKGTPIKVTKL